MDSSFVTPEIRLYENYNRGRGEYSNYDYIEYTETTTITTTTVTTITYFEDDYNTNQRLFRKL